jgi:hypothetical protein
MAKRVAHRHLYMLRLKLCAKIHYKINYVVSTEYTQVMVVFDKKTMTLVFAILVMSMICMHKLINKIPNYSH